MPSTGFRGQATGNSSNNNNPQSLQVAPLANQRRQAPVSPPTPVPIPETMNNSNPYRPIETRRPGGPAPAPNTYPGVVQIRPDGSTVPVDR